MRRTERHQSRLVLGAALLAAALTGCRKSASETGWYYDDYDTSADSGWEAPDDDELPPEQEDAFLALRPAETDVFVFVANPSRNTVTRVNVDTLEVRTTDVGADPHDILTTPDNTTCAVFNRGDDSVSLIDADTLEQRVVPVRDDFNRMVMSPDGRWVALFHDVAAERPDDPPPSGVQSYNEVSFVDLVTGEHFGMAVDYQPREIQFTPSGDLAAVITKTSLGMVDLTARPLLPRLIPVTDVLVDPPSAEEVVLAPDGSYAFVRQFGAEDIVIVDLADGTTTHVPVGLNPTDLDLTPDGARAIVVSRGSHELALFDVAAPYAPPEILGLPPDVSLGSVLIDPTGRQAIVYTTASLIDRYATWDLATDAITLRQLVKPIRQASITPDGNSLLVFHTLQDAETADPMSPFRGAWALTLVALRDHRQNPLNLPAEPIGFANSSDGAYGYFIMDGIPQLTELDYLTLLPEEIPVKSEPVYVGVLPDLDPSDGDRPKAWVSQEHVLGRMSFYDPDDASTETITGFELNAAVEE
jgi:DNA-binding beta-propeller fold protein YncE